MLVTRRKRTVPQVAETYGVAVGKVIAWIKSGELRAVNLAQKREQAKSLATQSTLPTWRRSSPRTASRPQRWDTNVEATSAGRWSEGLFLATKKPWPRAAKYATTAESESA